MVWTFILTILYALFAPRTIALVEGYDHMSTLTKLATKGWTNIFSSNSSITFQPGRIDGQCLRIANTGTLSGTGAMEKALPAGLTHIVFGFAVRLSALPTANGIIWECRTSGGAGVAFQIAVSTTGKVTVNNGSGTVQATGTATLNAATWYYLEFDITINGASGSVTSKVDGTTDLNAATINVGSTAAANIAPWKNHAAWAANAYVEYDDIYVINPASGVSTMRGDSHVQTLAPTADGAHSDYTPNAGTNHYDRVNEMSGTMPDDDTTYVSDATVNHRDSYVFGDLTPVAGTVHCIQTNLYARKDDAGTRQIAAVARPGSTDRDGSTVTLTTSYSTYSEIRETNPDTSAAWTISEVNATEFGVKTVA